jgi:hypothetical protein
MNKLVLSKIKGEHIVTCISDLDGVRNGNWIY